MGDGFHEILEEQEMIVREELVREAQVKQVELLYKILLSINLKGQVLLVLFKLTMPY